MNIIKNYNIFLLNESATKTEITDFINDFGFLITLNLSKINTYAKDDDSKNELEEMQKNLRKPIINGNTYVELIKDINPIITNPKYLSTFLLQIKRLLEYIEPRVIKYVKDCGIKDSWLLKIQKLKERYLKIIE